MEKSPQEDTAPKVIIAQKKDMEQQKLSEVTFSYVSRNEEVEVISKEINHSDIVLKYKLGNTVSTRNIHTLPDKHVEVTSWSFRGIRTCTIKD